MKKAYEILSWTMLAITTATGVSAADTRVVVESQTPKWTISKYLAGAIIFGCGTIATVLAMNKE